MKQGTLLTCIIISIGPLLLGCESKTTSSNSCGDGIVDVGEDCDQGNLASQTCTSLGYNGGVLACTDQCQFELSSCQQSGQCGNGQVEGDEQCDGENVGGNSCISLNLGAGDLTCNTDCRYDFSQCENAAICGNLVVEGSEHCDGENLNGQTCETKGYYGGELRCTDSCEFNYESCMTFGYCGNGEIEEGFEECEGTNLNGATCESLGYHEGGSLSCSATCEFDASGCLGGACGDGELQVGTEECDSSALGGATCESLGYYGGTLGCNSDCTYNIASCEAAGQCGDGELQAGTEECDGTQLGGTTCTSLGYYGGTLSCTSQCQFNLSSCVAAGRCGDLVVHDANGEECDGTNLDGATCESLGYHGGTLSCNQACSFDVSDCASEGMCGDGAIQAGYGEECDQSELGGESCFSLGYYGGALSCGSECTFDLADCSAEGRCGDGTIQSGYGETCDDSNLGGETCQSLGYYGGTLACSGNCEQDLTDCAAEGRCGDGTLQAGYGEECEGSVGSETCTSVGFWHGTSLTCTDCRYDNCHSITQISAGVGYGCALEETGLAACWGLNTNGRLGTDNNYSVSRLRPTYTVQTAGVTFRKIATGTDASLAISTANTLYQWGDASSPTAYPTLRTLPSSEAVLDIAAGEGFYCVLDVTGAAFCRGDNNYGQLGVGDNNTHSEIVAVLGGHTFTQISALVDTVCALDTTGVAWCWGRGDSGQIGDTQITSANTPQQVTMPGGVAFVAISAGSYHVCAISTTGEAWCWGEGDLGKLGNGSTGDADVPIAVNMPSGTTFTTISSGGTHTCAMGSDGAAYCWGEGAYLCRGSTADSSTPVSTSALPSGRAIASVDAGGRLTCMTDTRGNGFCCGLNTNGSVGINSSTTSTYTTPQEIASPVSP